MTSSSVLPSNVGELLLFQGSRQWAAKYGAYVVAPQASSCVADFDPAPFVSHGTRTLSWQANRALPTNNNALGVFSSDRSGVQYVSSTEHFDTVMTILEGLHPSCVITIQSFLTYESMPTDSPALRPLARMPLPIRPHIEELYANTCAIMEPFCMVGENANGNFFGKVSSAFKKSFKMLSQVGVPVINAIDKQSGGAGKALVQAAKNVAQKEVKKIVQNATSNATQQAKKGSRRSRRRQNKQAAPDMSTKVGGSPFVGDVNGFPVSIKLNKV